MQSEETITRGKIFSIQSVKVDVYKPMNGISSSSIFSDTFTRININCSSQMNTELSLPSVDTVSKKQLHQVLWICSLELEFRTIKEIAFHSRSFSQKLSKRNQETVLSVLIKNMSTE